MLYSLTGKIKYKWGQEEQEAFESLLLTDFGASPIKMGFNHC